MAFFAFDTEILLADVTKPEISNIPTLTRPVTSSVTSRSNFTPCLASSITWLSNGVWILEIGPVVWDDGDDTPPPPKKIERVTHQTPTGRRLTFEQYYIFPENFKTVTPLTSEFIPKVMLLTRAWPGRGGGGRLTPPPNIRDIPDAKHGRPFHTTVWYRLWFFKNPLENFRDMTDFVTSLHATFGPKLAINFTGLWKTHFWAKMQMKKTKWRKMISPIRSISQFVDFFIPNISKKLVWGKWTLKSQKLKFSKGWIYVIQLLVVNQYTKIQADISIFDPQKGCFCL